MYKLFIVEDDEGIASEVKNLATSWAFDVKICDDFRNVTEEFNSYQPHIVLMDIGLPFYNGYHWCSEIRKISNVPVIFISSAADNMNIVMAVNMGADDFIAKPFDGNVLMAKVQALLRRSYDFAASAPVLSHKGAFLNTGDNTLVYNDNKIELSKNEYRILLCLMENKGKVVSREKLMERLWETDSFVDENTLTVNINRLRKKLDSSGLPNFIATKFGVGYIIE
ncbi:MAG: response regulator transcription factor [Clostridia bacterium]|nr:response regulator transcription factor [Clostridia bacterium]